MQRCERCDVKIRGHKARCPLCGGKLAGNPENAAYPTLRRKMVSKLLTVKIGLFLLAILLAAMVVVRVATGEVLFWMPLTFLIGVIVFVDICVLSYYRGNPLRLSTLQIYLEMILCMMIDYYTGWHGWSVMWVAPAGFLVLLFSTISTGVAVHMHLEDYAIYLLFETLLSLLQGVIIWRGYNPLPLPALISMAIVVLFFIGILLFRWREFRSASRRYFNR